MSNFHGHKLTNVGRNLIATLVSEGKPLKYMSVRVGDGELGSRLVSELTSLVHERLRFDIASIPKRNNIGQWDVVATFSNRDLNEPMYFREWGIYAQDPANPNLEVLVLYANAGATAEYINVWNGQETTLIEEKLTCMCTVSSDIQVTAVIDPTQIAMLVSDYDPQGRKTDIFAELDSKAPGEHLHDDRYYTELEINALLKQKAIGDESGKALDTLKFDGKLVKDFPIMGWTNDDLNTITRGGNYRLGNANPNLPSSTCEFGQLFVAHTDGVDTLGQLVMTYNESNALWFRGANKENEVWKFRQWRNLSDGGSARTLLGIVNPVAAVGSADWKAAGLVVTSSQIPNDLVIQHGRAPAKPNEDILQFFLNGTLNGKRNQGFYLPFFFSTNDAGSMIHSTATIYPTTVTPPAFVGENVICHVY